MLKLQVISIMILAYAVTDCSALCYEPTVVKRPGVTGISERGDGLNVCTNGSCVHYRYSDLEALYGGLFQESENEYLIDPNIDGSAARSRRSAVDGDSCCKTHLSILSFKEDAVHQTNVYSEGCVILQLLFTSKPHRFQHTSIGQCHHVQYGVWGNSLAVAEGPASNVNVSCNEDSKNKDPNPLNDSFNVARPTGSCDVTGHCTLSQIKRIVYLLAWCPSRGLGFYPFGFGSHCVCVNPSTSSGPRNDNPVIKKTDRCSSAGDMHEIP